MASLRYMQDRLSFSSREEAEIFIDIHGGQNGFTCNGAEYFRAWQQTSEV